MDDDLCREEEDSCRSSIDGLKGRRKPLAFLGVFQCHGSVSQLPFLPADTVSHLIRVLGYFFYNVFFYLYCTAGDGRRERAANTEIAGALRSPSQLSTEGSQRSLSAHSSRLQLDAALVSKGSCCGRTYVVLFF